MSQGSARQADAVERLIEQLIASPPVTQQAVEQTLGVPLRMTEENADWRQFEANAQLSSGIAKVDYRLPLSAEARSEGPLLVVEFGEDCPSLDAIRKRFGPLQIGELPSPHAENAVGYFDRTYPWGQVSFGYRFLTPQCLSSVAFNLTKPPRG